MTIHKCDSCRRVLKRGAINISLGWRTSFELCESCASGVTDALVGRELLTQDELAKILKETSELHKARTRVRAKA